MLNSTSTDLHKNFRTTNSLSGWCEAYLSLVAQGSSPSTLEAKKRDLRLFLTFIDSIGFKDDVQRWTPSLSKAFKTEMLNSYSAATVARMIATLGHFAKWLGGRIMLVAGNPMDGVKAVKLDEPAWNGLTKKDLLQLKSAVDIRLNACKRKDQNPLLEAAVFYLLLYTGIRESELVNLNYGQYKDSQVLLNVKRKGQRVSNKVAVPKDAAFYIDRYLIDEERDLNEPLFKTRGGNRLSRMDVFNICKRISRLTHERTKLTPHMLRHTFLKRVTDKHGIHIAQQLSGNVSVREIFRYARPSYEESASVVENLF
jgi:integrase/recombinase XerD